MILLFSETEQNDKDFRNAAARRLLLPGFLVSDTPVEIEAGDEVYRGFSAIHPKHATANEIEHSTDLRAAASAQGLDVPLPPPAVSGESLASSMGVAGEAVKRELAVASKIAPSIIRGRVGIRLSRQELLYLIQLVEADLASEG